MVPTGQLVADCQLIHLNRAAVIARFRFFGEPMHRSLIALVTIALPLAAQQPVQPAPGSMGGSMHLPGQISTSATGEARYTPDRATISLGVQTRAVSAARASADNATKQRAVIDASRAQGIAADQITTENYSLSAIQVYEPNTGDKSPRITGYNVSNTVRVEDPAKAKSLLTLLDDLEEQEDSQHVYANFDIPDAILAEHAGA